MREHGGGSQRNSGTGGFVLCGCQSMAVAIQCRTDRCLPFAPSLCDWLLYYVLPHIRTGYDVSDEAFDKQIDELGWSAKDIATMGGMYMDRAAHNIKQSVRDWFRELLELLFQSAALVIDTIRTFFLIVLAILGPIAFAISVYDGFQATLTQWITRYISVYLWLPVSDLFSSILARIQVLMLQKDIQELSDPNFIPDRSNSVYIIFMIIGIIGYFTIPTVSNWIIQAGGMGNMSRNINSAANKTGSGVGAVAGAATGNAGGRVGGKLIKSNQ